MLHVTHLLHILYWTKIWTPAYIQVIVFDFSYLSVAAVGTGTRGPNFGPVKYVKEVSHVKHMHANSILVHFLVHMVM